MSAVSTCTLLSPKSRARLMMNSRCVLELLTAVMLLFLYA
jgi:hypothetical protein